MNKGVNLSKILGGHGGLGAEPPELGKGVWGSAVKLPQRGSGAEPQLWWLGGLGERYELPQSGSGAKPRPPEDYMLFGGLKIDLLPPPLYIFLCKLEWLKGLGDLGPVDKVSSHRF